MRLILQVFYSLLSATILSLAIPNEFLSFGSPLLGFIALIPLYLAISKSHSYKEASILNAIHVTFVHLLSSFWLSNFKDFAIFTLGASALGTGVIGAFFGWMLFFPYSTSGVQKKQFIFPHFINLPSVKILYFACTWTIWEWTKSNGFLGYPWGTLSMTAYKAQCLIQIADITGAIGISFLMALFSALIGEGLNLLNEVSEPSFNKYFPRTVSDSKFSFIDYRNSAFLCLTLLSISLIYGLFKYSAEDKPVNYLDTIIVQQNTDPWKENEEYASILISEKLTQNKIADFQEKKSDKESKPDLIIWSEAVLRLPFPKARDFYLSVPKQFPLIDFIKQTNCPFIIGAPYTIDRLNRFYGNAAVFLDSDGNFKDSYCKMHLVPFAEVIPGLEFEFVRKLMNTLVGFSNGWRAGDKVTLFEVSTNNGQSEKIVFSTPICFEDAFPDVCRSFSKAGCQLFVNLTDDSWSLTKSAEYQHFVIAAMRSIEFRKTMIRCTNSGYTAVIDSKGRVIADLPLFEQDSLRCKVPVFNKKVTVFEIFGFWLVWVSMIFCVFAIEKSFSREK